MSPMDARKKGNLQLVPGGLSSAEISPDEWLEREMRTLMASWKASGGTGAYASRGIANAAHGINHPHRILARRMREAHDKRVRHERVRRMGEIFEEYADRLYRVRRTVQQPDCAA